MKRSLKLTIVGVLAIVATAWTEPVEAQTSSWLKRVAGDAAKRETARQVDRMISGAIRCAVGEMECVQQARDEGRDVVMVDDSGEVIMDEEGEPVMDPNDLPPEYRQAQASAPVAPPVAPGADVNVSSDFQAGERIIFYDDYSADTIGDFPRRLELVKGNWEVVEWQGRRLLRNTGPRYAAFVVQLPETLPEQFTIETDVFFPQTNQKAAITMEKKTINAGYKDRQFFQVAGTHGTGVAGYGDEMVESMGKDPRVHQELVPVRIMVDGNHVKVFVGDHRVANAPNVTLLRTDLLQFSNTYMASEKDPMYFGPIRVAAGGRDLYDALETDGRVAVHDILFDTDRTTIQPESAEVLGTISAMLEQHPDLRLLIEGHTDGSGDFDHNMELSQGRAKAVKAWLIDSGGIDAGRLRTVGLGPTQPKAPNASDEGRRQNRRVELVKF